jgi:prepilin peptidase CpaA
LYLILSISIVYDLKYKKIPNWLTFAAMIIGLAFHIVAVGLPGLIFSFSGLLTGLSILLIFYLMGGMGAGDVKLMGGVGAFLGAKGVFYAFLATSIVGGLYAIFTLAWSGDLKITLKRYGTMLKIFMFTRQFSYISPSEKVKALKMPYGVAIALGTVATILLKNTSLLGGLR